MNNSIKTALLIALTMTLSACELAANQQSDLSAKRSAARSDVVILKISDIKGLKGLSCHIEDIATFTTPFIFCPLSSQGQAETLADKVEAELNEVLGTWDGSDPSRAHSSWIVWSTDTALIQGLRVYPVDTERVFFEE